MFYQIMMNPPFQFQAITGLLQEPILLHYIINSMNKASSKHPYHVLHVHLQQKISANKFYLMHYVITSYSNIVFIRATYS